jgi:hypothetical protein
MSEITDSNYFLAQVTFLAAGIAFAGTTLGLLTLVVVLEIAEIAL